MILDGKRLGVERTAVGASDVEKHPVILRGKVHVHVVRREGQASCFGGSTEIPCLDDC